MSNLSTLPKGDSAWLLRKAIERIMEQVSVLETNIGSSTTGNSANTQIIFNDNGTLRGDAGLVYNKTTDTLTAGAATITGDLDVSGNGAFIGIGRVGLQRPFIPTGQNGTTTLDYRWYSTGTTYVTGARIRASSEAAWSSVSAPTRLMFETVPSGSVGLSERYRISGDGLHTWSNVNNVGGTQMTLDGTGLGIGGAVITTNFEAIVSSSGSLGGTATVSNIAASAIGNAASFNFRTNANFRSAGYSSARIEAVTPLASNNTDLVFYNYKGVTNSGDETMRITSSGNVGIGVTPSAWDSSVFKAIQIGTGVGQASVASRTDNVNNTAYGLNYYYGTGAYRYIAAGRATSYEQASGQHYWNIDSGTQVVNAATSFTQAMTLTAAGNLSLANGNLVMGTSGKGIDFSAVTGGTGTATANVLNDYEEGTFTPTITASTPTLTTTTVNEAVYTKIGRLVSIAVDISIVNIGTASGQLFFSLPFNQTPQSNVGALRELGATGQMGQIIYQSATQVSAALYNNGTLIVNGYRIRGTYTYTV